MWFECSLASGRGAGEGGPSFYTKFRKKKASYILNIHNKVTSSQCDSRFIYKEPSTVTLVGTAVWRGDLVPLPIGD